jgi:NAD(P)-dependent dehydrogenase (short-subunit alcohol dehydrogenase family)
MKRVLVTGGNTGIGLALCRQLSVDHGCHVILGSRSE